MDVDGADEDDERPKNLWAELKMRTEYMVDHNADKGEDEDEEGNKNTDQKDGVEKVLKEELVRGFKYGSTYVPCPDGQFERLTTKKGIEICGFFDSTGVCTLFTPYPTLLIRSQFRRELAMSDVQYVWADPSSAQQQVALSAIVQAMDKTNMLAIARWVTRDGSDSKMGVLSPCSFEAVDCLLWVQVRSLTPSC